MARDVIRVVPEPFELTGYVARQSWISAFTSPVTAPELTRIASGFQARNVQGDFGSNAGEILGSHADNTDVFLIDIASDRHGVVAYEGGYVSLTPDHRRAFGGIVPGGKLVPFGSEQHRQLFTEATQRGAEMMDAKGLFDKALVLRVPFTDRTTTGEPMTVAKDSAETINARYEPYYQALSDVGFQIIDLPANLAVADPEHAWGLGQDHYAGPAYQWWADQIGVFVRGERA